LTQKINWWQIIAVLILVAGAFTTVWSAYQQDASLRSDLLTETRLAELGIGTGEVTALSGSSSDITSPDYRVLKAQLERIRLTAPQARFAYLMGQRPDGTIFFYSDSESTSSRDYSPPGQDYSEVSTGIKQIFVTGVGTTEGPYSDRWGTWVSGLVPVTDPRTGNIIAVFGIDIDAADWNLLILRACLPMLITTLLILMLVLIFARFNKRSEEEKERITESEEHLREKESFQRVLLDNLTSGIVIVDVKTHIIDRVNPTAAAMFGANPDQIIGKKCHELFCPVVEGACPVTDLHQEIDNAERVMQRFDGTIIPVLKSVKKIRIGGQEKLLENFIDITKRKQAEDKLHQLSDRLSLATRAGGVGIWDFDVVKNTLTWDDQMFALYGITREQFGGAYEAWQAGLYPEDRAKGDEEIQQALNGEKEFDTEFRVLWPNGSIRNIRAVALVQRDAAGKPLRMIGTNWDITEQKKAEDVIRESEEQIRLLLDSTAEAIYGLDIHGNCTFCNNSCLRLLGYKNPEELLGKNMHWLIHLKYPDGTHFPVEDCRIFKAFNKGVGTHVDDEVLWRSDGTSFPAEYWSYPQRRFGVVVGAVVTFLDITARKNAERVLQQSEEKYRLLIKNSHDIIYTINREGILTFVSAGWTALLGQPVTEVTGRPFQQFVHPDDIAVCSALMQKVIDTGQRQTGVVYRVRHADGTWRWHTTNAVPLKNEAGSVVAFEGSASDITERKHAEDAVLAANKKLNILNSVTRHDVLNQITALVMLLEIVGESVTDKETIDFVSKAKGATERINRQIDFTKEYQDIGVQAPQWQNVSDLIMSAKAQLTECPYELVIDPGTVEIYADPLLLKVFYNLLENAIRHGENVSTVHFSSHESEDRLILICEDNGVGIDAESKKHLFQRGFGKHTGYGLYLMREILSISGITINETGEPGKGARFEMVVPKGVWRTARNVT
jgi:PAS domain S-box-containing protein